MPRPPAPEFTPASKGPSMGLIGAVVALIVALIAVLVWVATRDEAPSATGSTSALSSGGGISHGPGPDASVPQVHIYEDPQCPYCGLLERAAGAELKKLSEAGTINTTYTIMSFLDGNLHNDVSTRSANAMVCADDAEAFGPYHDEVYANQPHEGTEVSDEQLIGYAKHAGLTGAALETFTSCVKDKKHGDYVTDMQGRANRDGVSSTPTMLVNGQKITDEEMSGLMQGSTTVEQVVKAHPGHDSGSATTTPGS